MRQVQILVAMDERGSLSVNIPEGLALPVAIGLLEMAKHLTIARIAAAPQQPAIVPASAADLSHIDSQLPNRG